MATQTQQKPTQTLELDAAEALERSLRATPTARYKAVDAALQSRIEKVEELLPDALKGQGARLVKRAMLTFSRNAKLQECTPESFVRCVLEAAELGLAIDGKMCHAVPFNTKIKGKNGEPDRWENVAQCIPDYKGLVAVGKRTGTILDCRPDVICENDEFEAERRIDGDFLRHKPARGPRGPVVGAYAIFDLPTRKSKFDLMNLEELHHTRAKSKSFQAKSGPWITDENEMYKKTPIKRGMKLLAEDPAMIRALEVDDEDVDLSEPPPASTNADRAAELRNRLGAHNGEPPASTALQRAAEAADDQPRTAAAPAPTQDAEAPGPETPTGQITLDGDVLEINDRILDCQTVADVGTQENGIMGNMYLSVDQKESLLAQCGRRKEELNELAAMKPQPTAKKSSSTRK